jgi:hypothetical protein
MTDLDTYVAGLAEMFRPVEELVRARDGMPAGSQILDVDRAPVWWLPVLAQHVGVQLVEGDTEAQSRERIRSVAGFKRGTVASLRAAAQRTLTGTKSVTIDERTTSAYHFQISTLPGETPNPDVVYADIVAAKPAGLQFDYNLVSAGTRYWFTVREDFATWNDVLAGGTRTWQQLRDGA